MAQLLYLFMTVFCPTPTWDRSSIRHLMHLIKGEVAQTHYRLHKLLFVVGSGNSLGMALTGGIEELYTSSSPFLSAREAKEQFPGRKELAIQ